MSLTRKALSTSQSRFLGWLCCSPCMITCGTLCGLIACLTCGNLCAEQAANTLCVPCSEGDLKDTALKISHESLYFGFMTRSESDAGWKKLTTLGTETWKASDLFALLAGSLSDPVVNLRHQLRDIIYAVLNDHDFGRIESTELTEEDLKFIGNLLRTEIFTQLPDREKFLEEAKGAGIDKEDSTAMSAYLCGVLSRLISTPNFIFNALDAIGPRLAAHRDTRAANLSAQRATVIASFAAGAEGRPAAPVAQMPVAPASREFKRV